MGDVINLNKARKTKAKLAAKTAAATNRSVFGIGKAEKSKAAKERENALRKLEQSRREPPTS